MHDLIVVPLDGSKLAERAIALAVPLAEQHGARLVLLTVQHPILPLISGGGVPVRDPALDHERRQEQERYLNKTTKRLAKQTGVPVEGRLVVGETAEMIAKAGASATSGLIVMTTHGRGGFKRFWLGSVTDRVVRRAEVPVLLSTGNRSTGTRQAGRPLFNHLLVPLDGSKRAEMALRAARTLLEGVPGRLTLAHVVHPMMALAATKRGRTPDQEIVESYLEPLSREMSGPTLTVDHATLVNATVPTALMELVKTSHAECIAITSQGAGRLQTFMVGGTTDKLMRTSAVPVLVCPATPEATDS
ncbi:MAG: universal stress protein [Gemmatimonadaceae bacterium]